jgi:hypothetical protein
MPQRGVYDAEELTSRAAPLAPDATASQLEQGLRRPGVPRALFDEAQAEQVLWQEFRAHNASVNVALTEVL